MATSKAETKRSRPGARGGWTLEDAKAHFGEVVRRAQSEGPQRVSVRDRAAVVIMSIEELEKLAQTKPKQSLLSFLSELKLKGLDLTREPDHGRDGGAMRGWPLGND